MLTIEGIARATDPRLGRGRRERSRSADDADWTTEETASHALVLIGEPAPSHGRREGSHRPTPDFLAHLAATRQRAPQTRAGRRAEPAEAVAAYGSMLVTPAETGRVFRRSV